ncbi:MAG: hypothetical protein CR982_02385 [Candidatus Cloacimonadota bacterium]|nr:MAG: hypothetical protein CR982_02385 [Candidatus Cloacimonadota bacterium]PIE78549.1 MAG: hypothetical protein CSA15_07595 [Candidatus Delongbacteria bacterium]
MYVFDQIYIAIEGVTGVGKNEFAKTMVKKLKAKKLFDCYHNNPFINNFFKDPEGVDLATQLSFLISRYELLSNFGYDDLFNQRTVSNFIYEKDKIYSSYILSNDFKYSLYSKISSKYQKNLTKPDVVVYLRSADDRWLFDKIRYRDRNFEKSITLEYVAGLNESYDYFFNNYSETPLIVVNIDKYSKSFDQLADTIIEKLKDGLTNKVEI